jgi:hypothetical protein
MLLRLRWDCFIADIRSLSLLEREMSDEEKDMKFVMSFEDGSRVIGK